MLRFTKELEACLKEINIEKREICLLGSASIAAKDIVDNKDIEFTVTSRQWNILQKEYVYSSGFNKYSNVIRFSDKVECQRNSLIMFEIMDDDLFTEEYAYEEDGFRIVKPFVYMAHKILSNREKDIKIVHMYKALGYWDTEFETQVKVLLEKAYRNGWEKPYIDKDKKLDEIFSDNSKKYIFGTGSIGKHVFYKLRKADKCEQLQGFIVSKREKNEKSLFGKKVFELDEVEERDCKVFVSVSIQNMKETVILLKNKGFSNLIQAYQFYVKEDDFDVKNGTARSG